MTSASVPVPPSTLPAAYLTAEAAARENLDKPDHAALLMLLGLSVADAGQCVATTTDAANLNIREALVRAARILNPNVYVSIGNELAPNWSGLSSVIQSTDAIMRRFAASVWCIAAQTIAPPYAFPTNLEPDSDVVYVPYVDGDPANVTVESVAKAEAPAEPSAVVGTIAPAAPIASPDGHTVGTVLTVGADENGVKTLTTSIPTPISPAPNTSTINLPKDHALANVPVGTIVHIADATTGDVAGQATAITLPANQHRAPITVIGDDIGDALKRAAHWIENEALTVEEWMRKTL